MRGEQVMPNIRTLPVDGSSPHARGAGTKVRPTVAGSGIIPACAESSRCESRLFFHVSDHPRMRGEQNESVVFVYWPHGSSPHARGAGHPFPPRREHQGIIPACAGSSISSSSIVRASPDHPRMRGEQTTAMRADIISQGSSPHARGAG